MQLWANIHYRASIVMGKNISKATLCTVAPGKLSQGFIPSSDHSLQQSIITLTSSLNLLILIYTDLCNYSPFERIM